jgi:hypothetical protein
MREAEKLNLRIPLGTCVKPLAYAFRKMIRANWKKNGWPNTEMRVVFRGRGKRSGPPSFRSDLPIELSEKIAIYVSIKHTESTYKCEFCGRQVEKGMAICDTCCK